MNIKNMSKIALLAVGASALVTVGVNAVRKNVDAALPAATQLTATYSQKNATVTLNWNAPQQPSAVKAVTESFEDYTPFQVTTQIGPWKNVDNDGQDLYGDWTFDSGYPEELDLPAGWMVVDLDQVTLNLFAYPESNVAAHSGSKVIIAQSSDDPSSKWLISPQLPGDSQTVTFYAAATNDDSETVKVYYSTTGNELDDFNEIEEFDLPAPEEEYIEEYDGDYYVMNWQECTAILPEGTRFFAIEYCSDYCYSAIIDDITYIVEDASGSELPVLQGYDIYRNGEKINTAIVTDTQYTDNVAGIEGACNYTVVAVYNTDDSPASNVASVDVVMPAGATGLTGEIDRYEGTVTLNWTAPQSNLPVGLTAVKETFEDYTPFEITTQIGPWKNIDNDGIETEPSWTFSDYPDALNQPTGWVVVDFDQVELEYFTSEAPFACKSGTKGIVAISGNDPASDWLISPELPGNIQQIKFYAAALDQDPETIKVYHSASGNEPEDFTEAEEFELPGVADEEIDDSGMEYPVAQWQECIVELPEGTRYFAIEYCSDYMYAAVIDDITYYVGGSGEDDNPVLVGYDIYRNGEKVNTNVVTETSFVDDIENVDNGDYTYSVVAVYECGVSKPSNEVTVSYLKPLYPEVTNLTVSIYDDTKARLIWNAPDLGYNLEPVKETFESYRELTDKVVYQIGDWKLIDNDGKETGPATGIFYGNRYPEEFEGTHSWILINASNDDNLIRNVGNDANHGNGTNVLLAYGDEASDWIVSPELPGASQTITFYAGGAQDYAEHYNIYYSTTGSDVADFTLLEGNQEVPPCKFGKDMWGEQSDVPDWKLCSHTLPEGSKYFAIEYVGGGKSMLLDEITYNVAGSELNPAIPTFIGYDIYRNEVKLNEEPISGTTTYLDDLEGMEDGDYEYYVVAVYEHGESVPSSKETVTYAEPTFPEVTDLAAEMVSDDDGTFVIISWSKPADPASPIGYDLYRNNEKLNLDLITSTSYTDDITALEANEYRYHVIAIYSKGQSVESNVASVVKGDSTHAGTVGGDIRITSGNGSISVKGAEGQNVYIVNVSGMVIYRGLADGDITIQTVPGVYIVKAGNTERKVMVN